MPSNYTVNYHLNQWNADDRVLRADFNADNAKIDAAIKAAADQTAAGDAANRSALTALQGTVSQLDARTGVKLLKSGTLPAITDACQISTSGINWASWRAVYLSVYCPVNLDFGFGRTRSTAAARLNGGNSLLIFYPFYEENRPLTALMVYGSYSQFCTFTGTYKDLTSFCFTKASAEIPAGVTYKFWGEK